MTTLAGKVGLGATAVAAGLAVLALAPPSLAQQGVLERLSIGAEGGVGAMTSSYQRENMNYGILVQGAVRGGFALLPWLAVQVSLSSTYFPSSDSGGAGQYLGFTGGFRLEPLRGRRGVRSSMLVSLGVPAERLEAQGFGETRPVIRATTRAARTANRRVEFRIVTLGSPGAGP